MTEYWSWQADLALEIAPALLAVGYIVGYRASGIMVSGSLIAALVLIPIFAIVGGGLTGPLFPEVLKSPIPIHDMTASQIWSSYVRYIGAGAVAARGHRAVRAGGESTSARRGTNAIVGPGSRMRFQAQ